MPAKKFSGKKNQILKPWFKEGSNLESKQISTVIPAATRIKICRINVCDLNDF
jgi:hypothetical protein